MTLNDLTPPLFERDPLEVARRTRPHYCWCGATLPYTPTAFEHDGVTLYYKTCPGCGRVVYTDRQGRNVLE